MLHYWTNIVLGIALVAVAFWGLSGDVYAWSVGIMGAAIAISGFWGAYGQRGKGIEAIERHA